VLRSVAFVTGGMVHAGIRPKSTGDGWRVRTPGRPQSAALFAARCLTSGVTLLAKVEDDSGKRTLVICRSGKVGRGARKLLAMLLSDDEHRLLLLFAVSRRTMYGKGG